MFYFLFQVGGNIEDKDTAMTWHFFNVPPNDVEQTVQRACSIVKKNGLPVFDGEGCIEVDTNYCHLYFSTNTEIQ